MADSSRNILLAVLVVGVAVAIFYMMDPTLGGLLAKREGFQDAMAPTAMMVAPEEKKEEMMLPPNNPASVTGMQVEKFASGPDQKKEIDGLLAASQKLGEALQKAQGFKNQQGFKSQNHEGFQNQKKETFGGAYGDKMEGFQNPASAPFPEATQPANCYPKNQLAPQELLPTDPNSKWAAVNPQGAGDISGKNFLSAGALVGVNTVGQSLRNANQQLRSEPPCPQAQVSIWNQSTIEPDLQRKPLEGF
jgi:hypothetical protein